MLMERGFLSPLLILPLWRCPMFWASKPQANYSVCSRPRVLQPEERKDLIVSLREAVELAPRVPEVRVLLGMALCVDLQAQEAMEEMREAVIRPRTALSPS